METRPDPHQHLCWNLQHHSDMGFRLREAIVLATLSELWFAIVQPKLFSEASVLGCTLVGGSALVRSSSSVDIRSDWGALLQRKLMSLQTFQASS